MHRVSFNIEIDTGSASVYSKTEAAALNTRLYIMADLITARAGRAPDDESDAIASDTSFVVARLMPDVARVTAREYTVDIRVKSPIASAPTVLEIYTLKLTPRALKSREVSVKIVPFKRNFLSLFILSP